MPYRDYKCTNKECEYEEEFRESIEAPDTRECPKCGGTMKRMVSKPGEPNLIGPGFYQNDY